MPSTHALDKSERKKPKLLFLSTGNAARSQMAEGFLRSLGSEHFEVMSAGIQPRPLNPLAIEVMKEKHRNLEAGAYAKIKDSQLLV